MVQRFIHRLVEWYIGITIIIIIIGYYFALCINFMYHDATSLVLLTRSLVKSFALEKEATEFLYRKKNSNFYYVNLFVGGQLTSQSFTNGLGNWERPCTFSDVFCDWRKDHFTVLCLVAWPLNESEAGCDLTLIETSQLSLC